MTFQPYYATPVAQYLLNALIWASIMSLIFIIIVGVLMLWDRKFERKALLGAVLFGVIVGGGGGAMFAGHGDIASNASIVQANIQKKYDVQSVTFDFTTPRGGGHGWTPTQSDPQQVIIKVDNVSHVATLTQNPQTAEPTLVDVDTNKEIPHKNIAQ